MTIYALAPTGPWFLLGVPVMALWGVVGPSLQDMVTRRVSASEQGQLQGANNSLRSVAGMIAPGVFTLTFAYSIGWLPGAPFLLAAVLLVVAAGVTWIVTAPSRAADPAS